MDNAIGHVQTELDPRDAALMKLYDLLTARNAPKEGSFTSLDKAGKREYFEHSRRRSRANECAAPSVPATAANIRHALADAIAHWFARLRARPAHRRAQGSRSVDPSPKRPGPPISLQNEARRCKPKPNSSPGKRRPTNGLHLRPTRIAPMSGIQELKRDQLLSEIGDEVVTADVLAERVGICTRTVYRYVRQLRAGGHKILSGPGFGYLRLQRDAEPRP